VYVGAGASILTAAGKSELASEVAVRRRTVVRGPRVVRSSDVPLSFGRAFDLALVAPGFDGCDQHITGGDPVLRSPPALRSAL
jgi:hypothetical protein